MANPIDKLIEAFFPERALRRQAARARLRAYEAASPRDSWRPRRPYASADTDHFADAATLRAKARSLVQNVSYISAALDALVSQTIGTGIVPRAVGSQADVANSLFAAWASECDIDGRLDYNGIVSGAYRAMEQDGEVLILMHIVPEAANKGVPLRLQLLEVDWLDSMKRGDRIRNGIQYAARGGVEGYWLFDQHPGDQLFSTGGGARYGLTSRFVPAAQVIHLFNSKRPGQSRGITRFAPVIARARDLQTYEDAELARKNQEARISVLASGPIDQMANPLPGQTSAEAIASAASTGELGDLPGGTLISTPNGTSFTVLEPKWAPGHVEYIRHQLHIIAAGIGVTYEMMTGQMNEVNYSSSRVRMMDFRKQVESMQWGVLIPILVQRIWNEFLSAAVLAGKLRRTALPGVDYTTPRWEYINPLQDIQAEATAVSAGLVTLSESIRRRGYDPDVVFEELRADFASLAAKKVDDKTSLLDVLLLLQRGRVAAEIGEPAEVAKSEK